MKITAEFNSIHEVQDFINAFGAKAMVSQITIDGSKIGATLEGTKESEKSNQIKEEVKTVKKEESQKVKQVDEVTEDKKGEEVKVTKEQVRGIFTKLVKAGKQKEAKELTAKYGASKVVEINEDDYAAILKEAEELL